jgi:2Fe-2S ferredoxin
LENDVNIELIDRDGLVHKITGPTDINLNLMELIKLHELPVEGTCGGMAMCASCQVYILNEIVSLEKSEDEQAMLDEAWYVEDNSRLACQIPISKDIEGLKIELAPLSDQVDDDDW